MDIIGKFTRKSERNAKTWKDTKTYLSQRYDLLKLELLEKSTKLLSVILSMLIVIVCALVVLIYLSSAILHWLTTAIGAGWAYTIMCGLFILIIIIILATKDVLFVKPLIRKFSRILYSEEADKTDQTKDVEIMDADIEEDSSKGGYYE